MRKIVILFIISIVFFSITFNCQQTVSNKSSDSSSSSISPPKINTIAGTIGSSGSTGDGGLATLAKLKTPTSVCVDSSGNVYIADTDNHAIRKVNASDGKINTVAGTIGSSGSTGDGGLATSAKLFHPYSVYVDSSGNIYIADTDNHAIRKVNASDGKINTIAGTISSSGSTGDGGLATSAYLNHPYGVCVDSTGNIFIADTSNFVIRKVNASDGKINTVAGIINVSGYTGDGGLATSAYLYDPYGVCVDSSGNIFITDTENFVIRKVNASDGKINTIAGTITVSGSTGDGGLATLAKLYHSFIICVDSSGNVYIADSYNHAIRKVNASDGKINTIAGTITVSGSTGDGGSPTSAKLFNPFGVYVDSSGIIYIADTSNNVIRKVQ